MFMTLIAALAAQAAPATQATPQVVMCPPSGGPVAAPYAVWSNAHPLDHGFVVGRTVDLPVMATATVRLAIQPSKPLTGTHLATAGFEVKTAGRYAVAVGGATSKLRPLWLDIAGADGKPLKSVGHGHGPACSSITKVVEFDLMPGTYTLLATGLTSGDQPVRALVMRKA